MVKKDIHLLIYLCIIFSFYAGEENVNAQIPYPLYSKKNVLSLIFVSLQVYQFLIMLSLFQVAEFQAKAFIIYFNTAKLSSCFLKIMPSMKWLK